MKLILYIALVGAVYGQMQQPTDNFEEAELRKYLFEKCADQFFIRPVRNYSQPLIVKISMQAYNFRDLDEASKMYSVLTEPVFSWTHPCLTWGGADSRKWGHIPKVEVGAQDLWVPLILHVNAIQHGLIIEKMREVSRLYVYRNGQIVWQIIGKFENKCELRLKKFPYDTQDCGIQLESVDSSNQIKFQVQVGANGIADDFMAPSEVWDVITETGQMEAVVTQVRRPGFNEMFDRVEFGMVIKRKHHYYNVNMIMPTIFMLLILVSTGLMGPNSKRTDSCLAFLLIFIVLQTSFASSIPESSEIIYMLTFSVTHTIIAMILTCYALVAEHLAKKKPFSSTGTFLCFKNITLIRVIDLFVYLIVGIALFLTTVIILGLMSS